MTFEPAKPIEPGCKVIVTHGPDTGFMAIAIERLLGYGIDPRFPDRRTPTKHWGWATDPPPPGYDRAYGFSEDILMRIDDDDYEEEECHTQQLSVVSSQ